MSKAGIYNKLPIIFPNFLLATTVDKAFLLAAIFQTIVLSLILISKDFFDKKEKNESKKWFISIFYIFFITIISYTLMYILFGFGNGMLIN